MPSFDFIAPQSIEDAVTALAEETGRGRNVHLLAGGTDLLVYVRSELLHPDGVVDIRRLAGLNGIQEDGGSIALGPTVTYTEVIESPAFDGDLSFVKAAALSVGGPPTRNQGTVGGNIANASPAADFVPPLLALDARLTLRRVKGEREMALESFFTGPKKTVRRPDEMITRITIPRHPRVRGGFIKFGLRDALAIALVNAAAILALASDGETIEQARICLGAVAPTPIRAFSVEAKLKGAGLREGLEGLFKEAAASVVNDISPISDIRASREYRLAISPVVVRRALEQAARSGVSP